MEEKIFALLLLLVLAAIYYILVNIFTKPKIKIPSTKIENTSNKLYTSSHQYINDTPALAPISTPKEDNDYISNILEERQRRMKSPARGGILKSLKNFEAAYTSGKIKFSDMQELSPLSIYGYKTGKTSDLSVSQRRDVILYTWHAQLPTILPSAYRDSWENPGTYERYKKIIKHLDMLISTRSSNEKMTYAVSDWISDRNWLRNNYQRVAEVYKTSK